MGPGWRGAELLAALRDSSVEGNWRWQALSRRILGGMVRASDVHELFCAILEYDDIFAAHIRNPIQVPEGTVIVSGSGKERFKTFNVSTAAAIVAAAAGVSVIKGASRSVSAVSGSLDILQHFGLGVVDSPDGVAAALERSKIAFVNYRTFCPRFFDRYDGVCAELQPTGLVLLVAALCVEATAFVHGLAAPLSHTSAEAIAMACPHLRHGVVVGGEPAPGRLIDEYVQHGRSWRSTLTDGQVCTRYRHADAATTAWFMRVAQRDSHRDNARLLCAVLEGTAPREAIDLVDDNAALVVEMAFGVPYEEARRRAANAHVGGRASRLLRQLAMRGPVQARGS
jgi:anthranilate phosphoribosyltransferase